MDAVEMRESRALVSSERLKSLIFITVFAGMGSIDDWFVSRAAMLRRQEIEVASLVRLLDMFREHEAIATLIARWWGHPIGSPTRKLVVADEHVETPLGNVEFDNVTGLQQSQRAADIGFGRRVQYAGAKRRAGHAGV